MITVQKRFKPNQAQRKAFDCLPSLYVEASPVCFVLTMLYAQAVWAIFTLFPGSCAKALRRAPHCCSNRATSQGLVLGPPPFAFSSSRARWAVVGALRGHVDRWESSAIARTTAEGSGPLCAAVRSGDVVRRRAWATRTWKEGKLCISWKTWKLEVWMASFDIKRYWTRSL